MNKTTIVGYLTVAAAVIKLVTDLLNGDFSFANDITPLIGALTGAGFITSRAATKKVENAVEEVKTILSK